jgi:hypothetical protein
LSHTILLAFDIHYSWRTATAQQDENIMERGWLLQLGDLLPRGDVMRSDQGVIQALHCISFWYGMQSKNNNTCFTYLLIRHLRQRSRQRPFFRHKRWAWLHHIIVTGRESWVTPKTHRPDPFVQLHGEETGKFFSSKSPPSMNLLRRDLRPQSLCGCVFAGQALDKSRVAMMAFPHAKWP